MNPPRVYLDIETKSRTNLKDSGVYPYVQDPDFEILMCAFNTTGKSGDTWVIIGHDNVMEAFQFYWDEGFEFCAMNAQFERVCFSAAVGLPVGEYLDPERFHDPRATAGQRGFPQGLGNLARALRVTEKADEGKALINFWCKPIASGKRKGGFRKPEDDPVKWQSFIDYCVIDVDALVDVDLTLGDHVTPTERAVYMADQRINDRGLQIDLEMALSAKTAAELNQEEQKERVRELTLWDVENPGAPGQMRDWLLKQDGVDEKILPNMQALTVEALLEQPFLDGHVREVLELRQELALAAPAKFSSALTMQTGGRLRGTIQYFGAHTGRFSGRGTQPQNLPRAAFTGPKSVKDDDLRFQMALLEQEMAIGDLKAGERISSEDLKKLVRPMFIGPMTVVDYAAIEARVLAWIAGEEWALQAFRDGRDLYVETGKRMGGLGRSQGKVAVLALGYAGGAGALRAMCYPGDPMLEMENEELLSQYVHPWRRANPNIVRLWGALNRGLGEQGRIGKYLKMTHHRDQMGLNVRLHLPSGRSIQYHDVRWEKYVITDKKTGRRIHKEGYRYANPKAPFASAARVGTYGGPVAENATQGIARDILVEALLRLEAAGYRVVAHVHDEILVEGYHPVGEINRIMCQLPEWAGGLPLDGEGHQFARYMKR